MFWCITLFFTGVFCAIKFGPFDFLGEGLDDFGIEIVVGRMLGKMSAQEGMGKIASIRLQIIAVVQRGWGSPSVHWSVDVSPTAAFKNNYL